MSGGDKLNPAAPGPQELAIARLALRPKEAAAAIGISPRLLWSWTNQGLIPHLRLGKAIIYPVDTLREFLAEQAAKGVRP